jgi:hypothetical protein
VDVFATPQIQPSTFSPPKAQEIEELKDQPVVAPVDPVEAVEIEARSEQVSILFVHLPSWGAHETNSRGGGYREKVLGSL